jgi:hypothetical protein
MGVALRLLSGIAPGQHQSGTAASFDEARAHFESAWKIFLSKRTEADFRAWRDQRDWTARKYARPSRKRSRCFSVATSTGIGKPKYPLKFFAATG